MRNATPMEIMLESYTEVRSDENCIAVTSPVISEIRSDSALARTRRDYLIVDLRQRHYRYRFCYEKCPRSRERAADEDARCQRYPAGSCATGSGCSGT